MSGPWAKARLARADLRAARARAEQLVARVDQLMTTTEALRGELAASRAEVAETRAAVNLDVGTFRDQLIALRAETTAGLSGILHQVDLLGHQLDAEQAKTRHALRIVRDDDARAWQKLWEFRRTPEYGRAFTDPEPLVSVIVTTYRNWRLLRERSLPSVIAQTYENWECIVVGDAAPPEAKAAVDSFADPRIRFVNLPYRGPYPADPAQSWYIKGTTPFNTGMALTEGAWIGTNSDDDALDPTYIETLLDRARKQRAEVAYGQLRWISPDGRELLLGTLPPELGTWGMQASLFHGCLRFLPLQTSDWLFEIPNDWSWAERMLRIGVRFAMVEQPMVDYFPSHEWTDRPQAD